MLRWVVVDGGLRGGDVCGCGWRGETDSRRWRGDRGVAIRSAISAWGMEQEHSHGGLKCQQLWRKGGGREVGGKMEGARRRGGDNRDSG